MKTFRFLLIAVICILAGGRGIALGQRVQPPSGMVAWWPLDETSSPAKDLAGVNNVGTWMNNPTPVSGKVAGALSFNGTNHVEAANHAELNLGTGNFSIDAWVKRDSASTNSPPSVIIDKRGGSGIGYSLAVSYGRLVFNMSGTNYATTTYPVPADGLWHFVAVTVNRATNVGRFYSDGMPLDMFNPLLSNLDNTNPLLIGAGYLGGNQPWLGCIDELEIFNRELDSTEVQAIFNADSLGKCKDHATLIGHFMTPEGEPYLFDVTISDGDNLIEYDSVTYIETEVPQTFTMTLLYEVGGHYNFMEFPLTFSPCETVELEFYAVDPNTVQGRVRPYLIGKETGREVNLDWEYIDSSMTLTYTVATEPTGGYAFVITWVQTVNDKMSNKLSDNFNIWLMKHGLEPFWDVPYWECTNGFDMYYTANRVLTTQEVYVPNRGNDITGVQYVFAEATAELTPVGVVKVLHNFARIEEYKLTLTKLGGASYEPQFYYPQWMVLPNSSYILELSGLPTEYVGLTYPLYVSDSLTNVVFDLTPPRVENLEPYSFFIGGGGLVTMASYSGLTHFDDDSVSVNVSNEITYCDYWGCFVLPDSLTAGKILAYSEDQDVDTLVNGADWLDNLTNGYNIITVRISPSVNRLVLIPRPISCCQGMRGNVNGDPNNLVNVSDVIYLINYLFKGGAAPPCIEEADANGDGKVTVSDVVYLINYLFKGGPPPVSC